MKGPYPVIRCHGDQIQLFTLRGEPWPPQQNYCGVLLSQRDVILSTVSWQNQWRRISRERKEEVIRQNHPGQLSTVETYWWPLRRGVLGVAMMDRDLLNRMRRRLGEKLPILIPLSATIFHVDGIREECWITENGEPQAAFLPALGEEHGKEAAAAPLLVEQAFPSAFQMRRTRLFRVSLSVGLAFLVLLLGLAPWLGILRSRRDFAQMELNRQDRLSRIMEWEKDLIEGIQEPVPLIEESGLEVPWNFLLDLSRRSSGTMGIEVLTLGRSQFRLRLWAHDPQEITASYTTDPGVTGLEFSFFPEGEGDFPESQLVSLSLTGGYIDD